MESLERVNNKGYPGMLIFARQIRDINCNDITGEETYIYEDKLRPGFILYESENFDEYYSVKFFDGEKAYHWGADLYYNKDEENI